MFSGALGTFEFKFNLIATCVPVFTPALIFLSESFLPPEEAPSSALSIAFKSLAV